MPHNPSAKICLAIAMCEIEMGTECTVVYGDHHDMSSWSEKTAYDGCQAVIVGFNEANGQTSVNIRMTTGSHTGKIVGDVNTGHLRLSGVFRRVSASDESH